MGRCFSTTYRIILVIISISALVLSIMSATSCAFVNFDHQYKSPARGRSLQDEDGTMTTMPADDGAAVVVPEDAVAEEAPADDGTAIATAPEDGAAVAEAAPETTSEVAAPADDVATEAADATVSAADPTAEAPTADVTATTTTPEEAAAVDFGAPAPADEVAVPVTSPTVDYDAIGGPMNGQGSSELDDPGTNFGPDFGGYEEETEATNFGDETEEEEETEAFGSAGAGDMAQTASSSSSSSSAEPIATAGGEAGLFCRGEQSFSVTNLWGGTIEELEEDINEESDSNQSEELARNAVLAAAVLGSVAAFVLVTESIIGWRICCERWIVGLISLMACVSQGVTFLFFNSERYCDGDIVHEILNQEPCVMGQGAIFSVVAIVLYAIMIVMACRLPSDDPYALCCKRDDSSRNSDGGSSRGKFGMLGGSGRGGDDATESNTARSGRERERPNWISEESDKVKEENEMI